jgi:pimeloyl-ACP methyl ester carboxylesterase
VKKNLVILTVYVIFLTAFNLRAADFSGIWLGHLVIPNRGALPLILNIPEEASYEGATLDSPAQHSFGKPLSLVKVEGKSISFEAAGGRIKFEGAKGNRGLVISGLLFQSGEKFPLEFEKIKAIPKELQKPSRPQEPKRPFPYSEEVVSIRTPNPQVTLSGTLTKPRGKGPFPAAVLVTGSGPQNRNEELAAHKPFLVVSDFLTRNGIAVLRYDDRGVEHSTGDFPSATTRDLADDAHAVVEFLRGRSDINSREIGVIGHSEGGIIAPMIAARDQDIAFIIMLGGPGVSGAVILEEQGYLISLQGGAPKKIAKRNKEINHRVYDKMVSGSYNEKELRSPSQKKYPEVPSNERAKLAKKELAGITTPWMRFFLAHNPSHDLRRVQSPIMALIGTKDLQVPYKINLRAIRRALAAGKNPDFVVEAIIGHNHLFQEAMTGHPSEYGVIEQTISHRVLEKITHFIKKRKRGSIEEAVA